MITAAPIAASQVMRNAKQQHQALTPNARQTIQDDENSRNQSRHGYNYGYNSRAQIR